MYVASGHFTNKWAVHITAGEDVAKRIADENGFSYVSKVKLIPLFSLVLSL